MKLQTTVAENLFKIIQDAETSGCFITIYTPKCCSCNTDKIFVIGTKVTSISRINVECNKCPKQFELCDQCLGATSDGFYDVYLMANEFVEIPADQICPKCLYHNAAVGSCKRCHYEQYILAGKTVSNCSTPLLYSNSVLNKIDPKFYFHLDDCLSCT